MFGVNNFNPYAQNPYAVQYQPQINQQNNQTMQQPSQQPIQNNNSIIWVQGEAGAKSFLMTANTSLLLMDSEGDYFYIKTTDNTGMPTLRKFEYKETTNSTKTAENAFKTDFNVDMSNYITRDEFIEEMAKLKPVTQIKKNTKKEAEE